METRVRTDSYLGYGGRIILGRILRHTDFVGGLIDLCRKHKCVMSGVEIAIGSLIYATLSWVRPSAATKRGSERTERKKIEGPLEFVSGQGFICLNDDDPVVHIHGTVCDCDGRLWGGHFFEGGNPVHSTMDVLIYELQNVGMHRVHDSEIDLTLPVPYKRGDA